MNIYLYSVVTIPGYEDLSEVQQEAIRVKLVYEHLAHPASVPLSCADLRLPARRELEQNPSLDVAALHSALTYVFLTSPSQSALTRYS